MSDICKCDRSTIDGQLEHIYKSLSNDNYPIVVNTTESTIEDGFYIERYVDINGPIDFEQRIKKLLIASNALIECIKPTSALLRSNPIPQQHDTFNLWLYADDISEDKAVVNKRKLNKILSLNPHTRKSTR